MRFIKPLHNYLSHPHRTLREFAPGVWVQVRATSPLTSWETPAVLHRIQNALTSLHRKPSAVDLQEYLNRVERKAA